MTTNKNTYLIAKFDHIKEVWLLKQEDYDNFIPSFKKACVIIKSTSSLINAKSTAKSLAKKLNYIAKTNY